ncbi:putative transcription factor interactor and regulator CCHC(Zn) family [Helianthus anomalus]
MAPEKFFKKRSLKSSASIDRPRKAIIRCFTCKQYGLIASFCPICVCARYWRSKGFCRWEGQDDSLRVATYDSCVLKKMFGNRSKGIDIFEDKSKEDLEHEYLDKFYENKDVENGFLDEKTELQEYVDDYY